MLAVCSAFKVGPYIFYEFVCPGNQTQDLCIAGDMLSYSNKIYFKIIIIYNIFAT